jgi:HK97 family phage prohead protease
MNTHGTEMNTDVIRLETFSFNTSQSLPDGEFEGYGAVFGKTDDGREIERGAFTAFGAVPNCPFLYNHNESDVNNIIGICDASEDDYGLKIKVKLLMNENPHARVVNTMIKSGVMGKLSVGFRGHDYVMDKDTIRFTKCELTEVSLVHTPANPKAIVTKFGENVNLERLIESSLRDVGFSYKEAKTGVSLMKALINEKKASLGLLSSEDSNPKPAREADRVGEFYSVLSSLIEGKNNDRRN